MSMTPPQTTSGEGDILDPIFKSEGVALMAKKAIEEANNSLYGSHGFFLSLNGGEPDKHHLARPIEDLKARANRLWRENERLRTESDLLREQHAAMSDVMSLRRISNHGWEREMAEAAIKVWRRVEEHIRQQDSTPTPDAKERE